MAATRSVGARPPRTDGPDKVTGVARYVDDLEFADLWHGVTVRCPHPRARLVAIDTSAAAALPDVVCVTHADLPGANVIPLIAEDWPVLVADIAEHVGEPVVLVAAPTRAAARTAADRVKVEWQPLPATTSLDAALAAGAGARVLARCEMQQGDLAAGFTAAAHVVEGTYRTGHQEHAYIENQGMVAVPRGAALEFHGSLQCPFYVHKSMRALFGLEADEVRVIQAATGGGFGGKEDYPNVLAAHCGLLARKSGHPVKIVYERHEDIVATTKRHPARITHRTGVAADGTLLAMEIDVTFDGGAYTTLSPVVLSRGVLHAAGAYRCPNVTVRGVALATNTATNGAFRGFGAPQTLFAVERQMDRIARTIGLDPFTIRHRNAYRVGDTTPTGQVLTESVSALECLEAAEERSDFRRRWRELEATRARGTDAATAEGIGLALFWHGAGFTGNGERDMRSPAIVDVQRGGRVRVRVSSSDFGQGTGMVLAQIVADSVGVPHAQVEVVQPDTDHVPDSGPTVASRTVMVVGEILQRAGARLAATVREEFERTAGHPAGSLRVEGGALIDASGTTVTTFADAADAWLDAHGSLEVLERFAGDDSTFDEATYRGTAYGSYGWGCNVVEVDVDVDTLATTPTRLTMVADVGKAIHPTLCKGQIEGGTLQAIAWGYMEEIQLERGRYRNDRLQTYIIPTTMDVPAMETVLIENPSPHGPFGAKGVGELPMDGGAPAILAAIENATGIQAAAIPATPERLLEDLRAGHTLDEVLR